MFHVELFPQYLVRQCLAVGLQRPDDGDVRLECQISQCARDAHHSLVVAYLLVRAGHEVDAVDKENVGLVLLDLAAQPGDCVSSASHVTTA